MGLPKRVAEHVLNDLGITRPEDLQLLDLIAWERGAMVRDEHLDGSEARLTVVGRRAIITISTAIASPQRRRFSIAHELGHLELRHQHSNLMLCTSRDLSDWALRHTDSTPEQDANEFASALLLPERFFASLCGDEEPSLDFVAELAETFNVSLTATTLRYLDFCDEPCAVVFSQDGIVRWFRGSKAFEEIGVFVDVRSHPHPSSRAALFFQGRTVPRTRNRVEASMWFAPGRYQDDATIQEQSWAMPRYSAVLTLLWVDDDIEDGNYYWCL